MATTTETLNTPPISLTSKRILIYWLPLAASWLLMGSEMPFINATLARLGEAERMIAAFGVVAAISITIESPVINLLSTSTALAKNEQHYHMLKKFTVHLMILTTVLHVLMAWSPLFDVVIIDWMNIPTNLHEPIRTGLKIMILWSAAIAYRRFLQGILIRYDQTRFVGIGTIIRLISSAGTATVMALSRQYDGITVATTALIVGVVVECGYAMLASRKTIDEKCFPQANTGEELTYKKLVAFHWPLAGSSLLYLMTLPLIGAALARGTNPEIDLAAWPILSGLFFITRAPALAIPEVTIALYHEDNEKTALASFARNVGIGLSLVLGLIGFTGLSHFYFQTVMGVSDQLSALAEAGARLGFFLPLAMAGVSYYRGILTAQGNTFPITLAMGVELAILALVLIVGVSVGFPGVSLAAIAMVAAMAADFLTLYLSNRRRTHAV